jgi:RecA-family ATPase
MPDTRDYQETAAGWGEKPRQGNGNGHAVPRFTLIPFDQVTFDRRAPYLVREILPRDGFCVFYGPPKTAKSLVVFDLLMHISRGLDYRGLKTKGGRCVYVAAEGARGLSARVEAYRQKHLSNGETTPDFFLISSPLNLVADVGELIDCIRTQAGEPSPAIIAVDTLNRTIAGSESDDRDMGDYVKACDQLRVAFGCLVLLIHHCGIDTTRPRGHTSLFGAVDALIAIRRGADGIIHMEVEAMKDGPRAG